MAPDQRAARVVRPDRREEEEVARDVHRDRGQDRVREVRDGAEHHPDREVEDHLRRLEALRRTVIEREEQRGEADRHDRRESALQEHLPVAAERGLLREGRHQRAHDDRRCDHDGRIGGCDGQGRVSADSGRPDQHDPQPGQRDQRQPAGHRRPGEDGRRHPAAAQQPAARGGPSERPPPAAEPAPDQRQSDRLGRRGPGDGRREREVQEQQGAPREASQRRHSEAGERRTDSRPDGRSSGPGFHRDREPPSW